MTEFVNYHYFYLLFIIPILLFYVLKRVKSPHIKVSDTRFFAKTKKTLKIRLLRLPLILKLIAMIFLIIALSRPQSSLSNKETTTEGIDIIIALDISTSMLAQDFKPDRFRASVKVAEEFIKGRKHDKIGLVVFAGEAYTQVPLTNDYQVLRDLIKKVRMGVIEDGTAIGSAIMTSINRIKDSQAKSKVIILLTDGENNKGEVAPETAGEAAAALGIKIYTIGVGKKIAPYPHSFFGQTVLADAEFNIDEGMLNNIAESTGGKYFKAESKNKLEKIYNEIDNLEKTKIKTNEYRTFTDKYHIFLIIALSLLVISIILENTYLKRSL